MSNTTMISINKQAERYGLSLRKVGMSFHWKIINIKKVKGYKLVPSRVHASKITDLQKHQWLWELQDILRRMNLDTFNPRAHSEDWYLSPGTRKAIIEKTDIIDRARYVNANFKCKVETYQAFERTEGDVGCVISTTNNGTQWSTCSATNVEHAQLIKKELDRWITLHSKEKL